MIFAIVYGISLLFIIIIGLTLCVYLILSVYSTVKGSPFVPTKKSDLDKIFANIKLNKEHRFLELGSGDGRVVFFVHAKYNVRSIGLEINPLLYAFSRLLTKINHTTGVTFERKDFYSYNLSAYNVIYFFLLPDTIKKLTNNFQTQCSKGTIIISHGFEIDELTSNLFNKIDSKPFKTFFYRI